MIVVINFSHPLNTEAERIIREQYGAGDAVLYRIEVQLDMDQPVEPQLYRIATDTLSLPEVHGNAANVDCIIPPGHSLAASYLARWFPTANLIVMRRQEGPVVQFLPSELIRRRA